MSILYLLKYKEIKENIDNNIYDKDKDTIYKSKTSKIKMSHSNFELNKKIVISHNFIYLKNI